jgi:hypothetical protein
VGFTRSRPYKKNDNGHVEQKNWTHVRQLLGYNRLDDPGLLAPINALYRDCWEPLPNFFLPSAKLRPSPEERRKAKHDPCGRLRAAAGSSGSVAAAKRDLQAQRAASTPRGCTAGWRRGLRAIQKSRAACQMAYERFAFPREADKIPQPRWSYF